MRRTGCVAVPAHHPTYMVAGLRLEHTTYWRLILPECVSILSFMAEDINATFEHELKRLEKRVDALVRVCDQLQDENKSLKQRQDILTAERANLL